MIIFRVTNYDPFVQLVERVERPAPATDLLE